MDEQEINEVTAALQGQMIGTQTLILSTFQTLMKVGENLNMKPDSLLKMMGDFSRENQRNIAATFFMQESAMTQAKAMRKAEVMKEALEKTISGFLEILETTHRLNSTPRSS